MVAYLEGAVVDGVGAPWRAQQAFAAAAGRAGWTTDSEAWPPSWRSGCCSGQAQRTLDSHAPLDPRNRRRL